MTNIELLGRVAAQYLKDRLSEDDATGTARYLLDCLTAEQTAAVAGAILNDDGLRDLVEMRLPHTFLAGSGLPERILTTERATYFRNAACEKSAWLLANVGDDEQQGLTELVPIGAPQLLSHPELWVAVGADALVITSEHEYWWSQALKGLIDARAISLERYSDYVAATRQAILDLGQPIRCALGYALPALRLPRDTNYFNALNDKTSGHASRWKGLYLTALKKRGCYLVKQNPSQALLDEDTLRDAFEKAQDAIPVEAHPVIEIFISASSGWNQAAAALAECEWETVKPLFDGLKREVLNLGQLTLHFYDDNDPTFLAENDRDYLERLCKRKTTEAEEEDEQFYSDHRLELKAKAALKAKWDRFIYGAPVETPDFISGMAQCMQALFDQDQQSAERKLSIRSDTRTRGELKDLNRDAGLFFAFRYRGIKELLGRSATWDVGELFKFHELDGLWRTCPKPHVNRSISKAALQIRFYLNGTKLRGI
jgi:S-DNA-T family DNA segregation ATPase FtsK/SpoIIIE